MEKVRKSMAMLLAVMMLAGALPGAAWAEGTQTNERTVQAQEVESESRVEYQDAQDDSQPRYAEDEVVTVIVEMEAPAVMDYYQVSSYAATAMQWANGEGLITGVTGTTLDPQGSATRAQVATILMRFCEDIA